MDPSRSQDTCRNDPHRYQDLYRIDEGKALTTLDFLAAVIAHRLIDHHCTGHHLGIEGFGTQIWVAVFGHSHLFHQRVMDALLSLVIFPLLEVVE